MNDLPESLKLGILVFLGGGLGSLFRWLLGLLFPFDATTSFPWAIFAVNVLGSFILGVLSQAMPNNSPWLVLLGTGFCGGFTTFSTFSLQTLKLLEAERFVATGVYICGSVLFALLGVWIGVKLCR